MPANLKELHCESVSATETGDYFQVLFETVQNGDGPYLLVQRQFEMPDGDECYVETEEPEYCGHFRLRNARLTRDRFQIEFGLVPSRKIVVSFTATGAVSTEVKRILQVMIPHLELVRQESSPD